MSNDDMIVPVRHSTMSGVGSTAAGTIGGAAKGAVVPFMFSLALGAAAGAALFVFGPGALFTAGGAVVGKIILGGLIGGVAIGLPLGAFTGGLGGIIGGVKGGAHAARRVSHEKGAATMLDAQVAAYQAQNASAQTNVYAAPLANNDNKYNFPAQGSAMNQASSSIQADSAESLGTVNGQQLQRA